MASGEKFQLKNGKKALLQIWVEPRNLDKTEFALESLKRAIAWDEERFGLELDLERFMIVATDDFTMGAIGNLIPLVILFLFVGGAAWVGYQVCPTFPLHPTSLHIRSAAELWMV